MTSPKVVVPLVAAGTVLGGVLIYVVYTPTTTVRVINDTARELTVSACGSDPATLRPGQSVALDPKAHDPRAACIVYQGTGGGEALGCLYIPTTKYSGGATVKLSTYEPGVPASKCGD
jgi:hypothetical protein